MDIIFEGKHKSLTSFKWLNIPNFSVITGPNGAGKSQLLKLLYLSVVNKNRFHPQIKIDNFNIAANQINLIKGAWDLKPSQEINLSSSQQKLNSLYKQFTQNNLGLA